MTNHGAHDTHHVNYLMIFGVLCVFTALSVVADVIGFENKIVLIVIVLAIASAKALSVMAFFMHLKFETNWKYVLLAPTMILACGLPLALLPDVGVHYYVVTVSQERELRNAMKEVVKSENKAEPLTDKEIQNELKKRYSYEINLTTVARYRRALNIPADDKRKVE